METLDTLLNAATLALLAGLAFAWRLGKAALEAGVKTSAEEGAKAAVKEADWPRELRRELEKARAVERQEVRLQSYGALWAKLRPLAIYDRSQLDAGAVAALSSALSDWYFSPVGGLMLTPQVRDFYFALQDLLQGAAGSEGWQAQRHAGDLKAELKSILQSNGLAGAVEAIAFLDDADAEAWFDGGAPRAKAWRRDVEALSNRWTALSPQDKFTVLQQVASVLRTALTKDVDSRSR